MSAVRTFVLEGFLDPAFPPERWARLHQVEKRRHEIASAFNDEAEAAQLAEPERTRQLGVRMLEKLNIEERTLIIDEEAQIVWGMFPFMQSANPLIVGEAFKMLGGKIMMIQAIMAYMPVADWK